MPPRQRRTSRVARLVVDMVLLVLAVAGLLLFVGAPMLSGPSPWTLERPPPVPIPAAPPGAPAAPADAGPRADRPRP
ncbi:MAG: hypothetical protein U1F51_08265 [Burkholderiales bacterium]